MSVIQRLRKNITLISRKKLKVTGKFLDFHTVCVSNMFALIVIFVVINLAIGCQRSGRSLIPQDRSAKEIIQTFRNDFNMNVAFGLRKMGIDRRSGKKTLIIRSYQAPSAYHMVPFHYSENFCTKKKK